MPAQGCPLCSGAPLDGTAGLPRPGGGLGGRPRRPPGCQERGGRARRAQAGGAKSRDGSRGKGRAGRRAEGLQRGLAHAPCPSRDPPPQKQVRGVSLSRREVFASCPSTSLALPLPSCPLPPNLVDGAPRRPFGGLPTLPRTPLGLFGQRGCGGAVEPQRGKGGEARSPKPPWDTRPGPPSAAAAATCPAGEGFTCSPGPHLAREARRERKMPRKERL